MSIAEIIPDIWIGTIDVSPVLINSLNIQNVINCYNDMIFFGKSNTYTDLMRENMARDEIARMKIYLEKMCQFIYSNIKIGKPILLACKEEIRYKRSGLVVIAYLMKYGHMTIENAINAINSKTMKSVVIDKLDYMALVEFGIK
jgi:hypothetical protein